MLYQKNRERVQEKRVGAQMLCCIYVAFCFAFTLHVSLLHTCAWSKELNCGKAASRDGKASLLQACLYQIYKMHACVMCTAVFQDKNEKHSSLQVTM